MGSSSPPATTMRTRTQSWWKGPAMKIKRTIEGQEHEFQVKDPTLEDSARLRAKLNHMAANRRATEVERIRQDWREQNPGKVMPISELAPISEDEWVVHLHNEFLALKFASEFIQEHTVDGRVSFLDVSKWWEEVDGNLTGKMPMKFKPVVEEILSRIYGDE